MSTNDAPQPPGGPLREDTPEGPDSPGEVGRDPGPGEPAAAEELPPVTSEQDEQSPAEAELQEENAGTSLDQPSS